MPPTPSSSSALSQVEGVAEVTAAGAEQPAIRVRVNPMQLATMGLSIEDVRTAIVDANALSRSASSRAPSRRSRIETNAQLRTVEDYKKIIVKTVNGNVVRLSDGRRASSRARATPARRPCSTTSRRSC